MVITPLSVCVAIIVENPTRCHCRAAGSMQVGVGNAVIIRIKG
ncbi:MAG: hypothetical protein ACTSYB_05605 [Candidatus Helarchaeota archaeon]